MLTRRSFAKTSAMVTAALLAARTPWLSAAAEEPAQRPMRFGMNYVPRKRWWYCWLDWDQQAVRDDLSGVAGLGADHIRVQCLWPLFQPGIGTVNRRALANLHSLLDAADGAGLDVVVTVLNGWMSGLQFMPAWVAPLAGFGKGGNLFTDRKVVDAEKLLLRRIAETVGGHRRFLGFDIANEVDVLMNPKSNTGSSVKGEDRC